MVAKYSINDIKNFAILKGFKCLSENYINRNSPLEWTCTKGHQWKTSYQSFKSGGCPYCANKPPQFIEDIKQFALKQNGLCLSDEYSNARTNLKWKCKCGYEWEANWDNIKNKNKWCPKCAKRPRIFFEEVEQFIKNRNGKLLSDKYENSSSLLKIQCNICKNTWESNLNNMKVKDSWCPYCGYAKSQKCLFEIVKNIFPRFQCFYRYKKFDWLKTGNKNGKQEIDIFIKDPKSSFSLAIEYDGHQHYKPIDFFGGVEGFLKLKKLDALKENKIKNHSKDIKYFIRVPYWEKLTEENIRNILNKSIGQGANYE